MGFRVDSIADLPAKLQQQAAGIVLAQQKKRSKYRNTKTTVNGITFDSQKEARRYEVLLKAQRQGYIYDLKLQHEFTLQEAYTTCTGQRIRAIRYKADFTYYLSDGYYSLPIEGEAHKVIAWYRERQKAGVNPMVVEDVKSRATKTKDYELKKKLMAERGYIILEVCKA